MIDIHSHVIYGADDGARTEKEALRLLEMDQEQGADAVIATPHYQPESQGRKTAQIRARAEQLSAQLAEKNPALQLYTGNEVLYFDSMTEHLKKGWILPLAGSSYVLTEFYPADSWQKFLRAARTLRDAGFRPVFAHVERYEALRKNDPEELIDAGAYLQINVGSIGGGIFSEPARFCKRLLKDGLVQFLGSDMHRADTRPPELAAGLAWIRTHLPAEEAEAVISGNASHILRDEEL